MQLKAFIKKKATEKNISAQLVMQNYMLERLSLPTTLKPYWQKKLKQCCPAALPIPAREIFMTYTFCILCGAQNVIRKHCFKPWSVQQINAAAKKF